jgi:hypothetical protein
VETVRRPRVEGIGSSVAFALTGVAGFSSRGSFSKSVTPSEYRSLLRGCFCFAKEPVHELGFVAKLAGEELHRDRPIERGVLSGVDLAHAAARHKRVDPVSAVGHLSDEARAGIGSIVLGRRRRGRAEAQVRPQSFRQREPASGGGTRPPQPARRGRCRRPDSTS